MKKTILTITLLFGLLGNLNCQDILYKKDGTEIKAKVIEITDSFIKYKNFDQLDGPLRNLDVGELFMIIYQDGTKEVFAKKKSTAIETSNPSVKGSETIEKSNQTQINNSSNPILSQPSQSISNPQIKKYKRFNWGLHGGLNFPKWRVKSGEENMNDYMPSKLGYYAGLFSKIAFNNFLSLQLELSFVSNRFDGFGHFGTNNYSANVNGVLTLNYLQFPIFLKGTYLNSAKIKPYIFLGPSINVRLSAKVKGTWYDTKGNSGDINEDWSGSFNSVYIGLTGGLGCVFYFFFIEARYDFGLTDIGGTAKLNSAKVAIGFHF